MSTCTGIYYPPRTSDLHHCYRLHGHPGAHETQVDHQVTMRWTDHAEGAGHRPVDPSPPSLQDQLDELQEAVDKLLRERDVLERDRADLRRRYRKRFEQSEDYRHALRRIANMEVGPIASKGPASAMRREIAEYAGNVLLKDY